MNLFYLVLTALGSAGFSSILTLVVTRKDRLRDYSEKVIDFWQKEHNKLLERVLVLEAEVNVLKGIKCYNLKCLIREKYNKLLPL